MSIDADLGEATCYLDGGFDGYQNGLPLCVGSSIWEQGTEVWVGVRPPTDIDIFGRSDSEGVESKMHIMDAFLWGRCLTDDEVSSLYTSMASADFGALDFPEDNWQWADSPSRVCCRFSLPCLSLLVWKKRIEILKTIYINYRNRISCPPNTVKCYNMQNMFLSCFTKHHTVVCFTSHHVYFA